MFTIIIGDLNIPFSTTTRKKISSYLEEFNDIINQQDTSFGIYKTFHPKIVGNMSFPSFHGAYTKYIISWVMK